MTDKMIELLMQTDPEEWMYPIYIPSYNRAGVSPLLNLLDKAPEYIQDKVYVVCRASDSKAYRRAYPWATIVEQRVPWGIGPARMLCAHDADERGFDRIVMLDDDITRLGVLEGRGKGRPKSGRFSRKNTPWESWEFTLHCLAFGCKMADAVFHLSEDVAYGSARSAFMSSGVDVSQTATIDARGFPLCVLFIDTHRFIMRDMPREFRYEGEDLAMFCDTYEAGYATFLFNTLIFDDDRGLETTIPMSGDGEIDRSQNFRDAREIYQEFGQYLRVTNKNPETGAVKRIGVDWRKYHRLHHSEATHIMTEDVVKFIQEEL